jgi:hypothetical protein
VVTAPAQRELVRWIKDKGLSELRGLKMLNMSASALRYQPRPDRNVATLGAANAVWSIDFAFDRLAYGRANKCLVIYDDGSSSQSCIRERPWSKFDGARFARKTNFYFP